MLARPCLAVAWPSAIRYSCCPADGPRLRATSCLVGKVEGPPSRQGAGDNPIERTPSIHSILHLFPFTLRLDSPISLSLFHLSDHLSLLLLTGRERKAQIKGRLHISRPTRKRKAITFNRLLRRPSELLFDLDVNCAARRHRAPNMTTPSPSHLFPAALIAAQHVRYEKERSQCYWWRRMSDEKEEPTPPPL